MVKTTGLASGRAFYPSVGIPTYTKRNDMAGITGKLAKCLDTRFDVDDSNMAEITGKLVKCLDTRFDVDDSIVAVTSIANFSSWPDTI